jgi:2-hydroxychromene-2-carboxylate isomerase
MGAARTGTGPRMADVTFSFDPACPWTWRASRWLVQVAEARDLQVEWRAFSLLLLNDGDVPEQYRPRLEASTRALRVVEALTGAGRHEDAGRFYTELGTRVHDKDEELTEDLVREVLADADLDRQAAALDDPRWEEAVRSAHHTAFVSAGPDVGSPVLALAGADRALHGPVLAELPSPADGLRIWDALRPLLEIPEFCEVKRGRR